MLWNISCHPTQFHLFAASAFLQKSQAQDFQELDDFHPLKFLGKSCISTVNLLFILQLLNIS